MVGIILLVRFGSFNVEVIERGGRVTWRPPLVHAAGLHPTLEHLLHPAEGIEHDDAEAEDVAGGQILLAPNYLG